MATGCAGDQERLQGPCPGTPRPIPRRWPAHRIDGHRLRQRPGTAAGDLPRYACLLACSVRRKDAEPQRPAMSSPKIAHAQLSVNTAQGLLV